MKIIGESFSIAMYQVYITFWRSPCTLTQNITVASQENDVPPLKVVNVEVG